MQLFGVCSSAHWFVKKVQVTFQHLLNDLTYAGALNGDHRISPKPIIVSVRLSSLLQGQRTPDKNTVQSN